MDYCPHCRAINRTRKTTRSRTEDRDGQEVTIRTHSYHCARCSRFLYSNEQVLEPAGATAAEPSPEAVAAAETPPDGEAAVEEA